MRSLSLAAVLVAACSQPAPAPPKPVQTQVTAPPADAAGPSDEERLAAIQKAMNELDEAAQGCWAAAATDRFDIEGELRMMIEIEATSAKASVVTDTARNQKLAGCLVQLLGGYRWAPPLYGQTIELPFKFRAPDGQSVIDRRLVESHTQGTLSVAVLLDENSTGNGAASMFEVGLAAGADTGARKADRAELWYFLTPAKINGASLEAGDMLYIPAGQGRSIGARGGAMRAVLVVTPGGREGTARAGALPTPGVSEREQNTRPVVPLPAKDAKTYGPATIFLDPTVYKDAPLAASILQMPAGTKVPEHVHANETEMLYVLEGAGTMTIAGQDIAVTPTSVIQIPPNTKHAFTATAAVRAVQIYTPPGPEQRFKKR
ncbi:MAG TPA: cupin domain-containing protein [Kofleriaceae bacterium]|nr:cupin domain-containing protein [Kofleriaceae bacterium]